MSGERSRISNRVSMPAKATLKVNYLTVDKSALKKLLTHVLATSRSIVEILVLKGSDRRFR